MCPEYALVFQNVYMLFLSYYVTLSNSNDSWEQNDVMSLQILMTHNIFSC